MRKCGETVEIRVDHGYRHRGGVRATSWWKATVVRVCADGGVLIAPPTRYWVWPVRFARADVRKPIVRKRTGKVRGSGAPGGWVWP